MSEETIHAAAFMLFSLMEELPAVQRYAPFNWHSSHPRYEQVKAANLWTDSGELTPLGAKVAQLVADGNRVRMLAASPSSSSSASPSPAPGSDPGFYRLKALSWPEAADQVLTVAKASISRDVMPLGGGADLNQSARLSEQPSDPLSACPKWTGIPAKPVKPMKCGALAFLHIGKTGGSTVSHHLQRNAEAGNYSYFSLYNVSKDRNGDIKTDPSPGARFEEWSEWQALSRALDGEQPRVAFQMHHGMPGLALPGNLLETHLLPMKERLRAKGCDLTLVTVLRDGPSRVKSSLAYSLYHGHENLTTLPSSCPFFKNAANRETTYLLRGHQRRPEYTDPDSERSMLPEARRALSAMDFVGRTEELDHFVSRLNVVLGLPAGLRAETENAVPDEFKKTNFTDQEERCLNATTAADQELYRDYCED